MPAWAPSPAQVWAATLDDMSRRVAEGWTALVDGTVEISPFVLPAGLGPLPVELKAVATRVLAETEALHTALADRSEAVARELLMARRAPEQPRAAARFFDASV
jgi:hypothetical protein